MPPRNQTPATLLDLVIAKAKELRTAGVLSVELEAVTFTLAPPEPDIAALMAATAQQAEPEGDPWDALPGGFGEPTDED